MPANEIRLKLVDAQGQPAVGVDVAPFRMAAGRFNQFEVPPSLLESLVWQTSDAEGRVTLPWVS